MGKCKTSETFSSGFLSVAPSNLSLSLQETFWVWRLEETDQKDSDFQCCAQLIFILDVEIKAKDSTVSWKEQKDYVCSFWEACIFLLMIASSKFFSSLTPGKVLETFSSLFAMSAIPATSLSSVRVVQMHSETQSLIRCHLSPGLKFAVVKMIQF